MKFKESWYYCEEWGLNQGSNCSNDESNRDAGSIVDKSNDLFYEERDFASEWVNESDDDVEKEEHKKFTIGKAYTISDPRAVMIHIQHTSLTSRTVMASSLFSEYLSGLKLWQRRQYLLFLFSLSSAKNPQ